MLLAGFRHVTRLPADTPANRLFRLAWIADSSRFLAGVRRGALAGIVLPASSLLLPPYLYLLGTRLALMHAVSGFLLGAALISLMTFRTSQLPFVASYAPASDLNTVGPVVLIGGLIAVSTFARIERFALADVESAAIFWSILAQWPSCPPLAAGRTRSSICRRAFDAPAPGTTRLDLGCSVRHSSSQFCRSCQIRTPRRTQPAFDSTNLDWLGRGVSVSASPPRTSDPAAVVVELHVRDDRPAATSART